MLLIGVLFGYMLGSVGPDLIERMIEEMSRNTRAYSLDNPFSRASFAIGGFLLGIAVGSGILKLFGSLFGRWEKADVGDKVNLFTGIFAGLIASTPFLILFNTILPTPYVPLAIVGMIIGFSALAVYALQTMGEILPWMRGRARGRRRGIKILDTNVIIDGRVYDVARTGFLEGQLYVPGFVLEELQHIADSADPLRRQRGRRGLDVLRHLQADFPLEVGNHDRFASDPSEAVDARLVKLAKALGADIVTNDFNLNRVAALQDVPVLNLNDLALAMRPTVLPKETLTLTIVREGNQPGQGVGYLEDGTMVVVEQGKYHIGETQEIVVSQVIQTERGKMIFGDIQLEGHQEPDLPPNGFQPPAPTPQKRRLFRRTH